MRIFILMGSSIYDALRDLVPFVQLKKREKYSCSGVNLSKVILVKVTHLHGCFSRFSNSNNVTKLRKASHLVRA